MVPDVRLWSAGGQQARADVRLLLQGVRNTLAGEESQVELLKSQLKQLFRFSEDSRHLSDDVLAVVKDHQRYRPFTAGLILTASWTSR